jgi:hypothetical protein
MTELPGFPRSSFCTGLGAGMTRIFVPSIAIISTYFEKNCTFVGGSSFGECRAYIVIVAFPLRDLCAGLRSYPPPVL